MKHHRKYSPCFALLIVAAFFVVTKASSQTIIIYFVAPNATITANFPGALDSASCPAGYSKAQITSANVATFNAIAPQYIKYVYTQLQTGTSLRNNLNQVFRNSAGTVTRLEYWLADDRSSFNVTATNTGGTFVPYPAVNPRHVWPAAYNFSSGANTFTGRIGLGEYQLQTDQSNPAVRIGGLRSVDEVVLHESSHTQFTGDWSKWGANNDGSALTYGADGTHYFSWSELIGDQEGALNEGLATFYGYIMNDSAYQVLLTSYTLTTREYFVEARSVLAGEPDLYRIADRTEDRLNDENGNPITYANGDPIVIFRYAWKTVPGFYLLFAESTSTAFFSLFRNRSYSNKDTTMSMIRFTAMAMAPEKRKRFLTYACNRLALKMEDYNASVAGRADTSRLSSIFPFALLDLLTHFGMSDAEYRNDYTRTNPDRNPRAYAEYFSRRAALMALMQGDLSASPVRFIAALQNIINYCKQPANMF